MEIKKAIFKHTRKLPFLHYMLGQIYRLATFSPPSLPSQILKILHKKKTVFFVQIGSNDGIQGDPLHQLILENPNWSGIFIEPVGYLFERLKQNYKNESRFVFEKSAIGQERGFRKFYYVSEEAKKKLGESLPDWFDMLGSFDKNHILNHLDGHLEPFIVEADIECVVLEDIFEKHNVQTIDLLHTDTEGFDYKVLLQMNFKKYKPLLILYEHKHLTQEERGKARSLLLSEGYSLKEYGCDTLGIHKMNKQSSSENSLQKS